MTLSRVRGYASPPMNPSPGRSDSLAAENFSINPRTDGFARLDLAVLFGNENPVILEIGSGKGRFLVEHATAHPELNVIGIEKSLHYHRVIVDRLVRRQLPNVRAINHDAYLVLREMIPDQSIDEIHIYFPDPWPRPRERKRRMVRPESLVEMRRVLKPEGRGWYVTDHREYYEKARPAFEEFFAVEGGEVFHTPPRTNYEAKYQAEGRPIYEVRFRRRS